MFMAALVCKGEYVCVFEREERESEREYVLR